MKNTIALGDCLELMPRIPTASIDLILADLPFGVTNAKWDRMIDPYTIWSHFDRIAKPNAAIILFGQGLFSAKMIMAREQLYRYEYVWVKSRGTDFLNARRKPLSSHEQILVFYKEPPTYNVQRIDGKATKSAGSRLSSKKPTAYNDFDRVDTSNGNTKKFPRTDLHFTAPHPAIHTNQKPVDLLRFLIRTYTNEGDMVFDPTVGSGSTVVACMEEKRRFTAIESNPESHQLAMSRLHNCIAQPTLF